MTDDGESYLRTDDESFLTPDDLDSSYVRTDDESYVRTDEEDGGMYDHNPAVIGHSAKVGITVHIDAWIDSCAWV